MKSLRTATLLATTNEAAPLTILSDELPGAPLSRDALLDSARQGALRELRFRATVFNTSSNARHIVFDAAELEGFAQSFKNRPFLRDHSWTLEARGGTIEDCQLQDFGGDSKALTQTIRVFKPWSVEGVLDGTIDRFSIGWHSASYECTVCGEDFDFFHPHIPGKTYTPKGGEPITCEILARGISGRETSAVVVPAIEGTGVAAVLSSGIGAQTLYAIENLDNGPNRLHSKGDDAMDRVKQRLGLPPETTDEQALSRLDQLIKNESEAIRSEIAASASEIAAAALVDRVVQHFGLKPETATDGDGLVAALLALTNPAGFVKREEFDAKEKELARVKAEARVDQLMRDGKFSAAEFEFAVEQCLKDEKAFERWAAGKPAVVPANNEPPAGKLEKRTEHGLDETELAICERLNIKPEEYLKQRPALGEI